MAFANTFTQMNSNLTLIVPCHSDSLYAVAPYWSQFHNIRADCGAGIDDVEEDGISIYTFGGRIVVEGAEGETVRIYDITGRRVLNSGLPAGVYLVKVGDRPARKVVVMR